MNKALSIRCEVAHEFAASTDDTDAADAAIASEAIFLAGRLNNPITFWYQPGFMNITVGVSEDATDLANRLAVARREGHRRPRYPATTD